MARRLEPLTLANLDELPVPCRDCVFWELDPVAAKQADRNGDTGLEKEAWLSQLLLDWGTAGVVLYVDDEPAGFAVYAPAAYLPRIQAFPTAPVSPDAVVLATGRILPRYLGLGLGKILVQAVAKDVLQARVPGGRGVRRLALGRAGLCLADRVPPRRRLRRRPRASAQSAAAARPALGDHLAQRDGGGGGAADGRDPARARPRPRRSPSGTPSPAIDRRRAMMIWRFLADVVMVVHGALLVFFVIGGFLAWRWPKLIWAHLGHRGLEHGHRAGRLRLPGDRDRRSTSAAAAARRRTRPATSSTTWTARIWPEGATPTVEKIGFALVVISYVGFFVLRHVAARQPEQAKVRGDSVGPRT